MPLYTYECRCGARFDQLMPMSCDTGKHRCPECGKMAKKIIVAGHGGIQCDSATDVKWLDSACKTLLPDDHRPIETRGEYNRYLKDHNIVQRT